MSFTPVLLLLAFGSAITRGRKPLEGIHFKAANYFQPGSVFERDANGKLVKAYGPPLSALEWVSKRLGFAYTVVVVEDNRVDPLPNGTWTGCYGLLANKEVDFIFAGMTLSVLAYEIADFTATIYELPITSALPAPKEENRFLAPIQPFSLPVWMILLGTILAICSVLLFISSVLGENIHPNEFWNLLLVNVQLLVGQGGFEGGSYQPFVKRVALVGWLLCVLILANVYTSSFISASTTPRLQRMPETIHELVKSEYQYVFDGKGLNSVYLYADSGALKVIGDYMRQHPEKVLPSAEDAFLKPRDALEWFVYLDHQATGQCRAIVTKTPWYWDYYVFAAQKGSPYTSIISKELLHLKEAGIYLKWMKAVLLKPWKCLNAEQPKIKPLKLADVGSVFLILLMGMGSSLIALAFEFVFAKIAQSKTVKLYGTKHLEQSLPPSEVASC